MGKIQALIDRLRQAKADLIANREADATVIALDQIALTKLRLQQTGTDSKGQKFEGYTEGYKAERKEAGFQVGFVDFTRRGRTLGSIHPVVVESSIFAATVKLEASDEQSRAILRGLSIKRGNILQPSEKELQILRLVNRKRIAKYFKF